MRIKLNLIRLTPDRNPAIYWLHVDLTCILFIKQLKEKVQKVLKESRDVELCLDDVPFLDEDDINAINENEEITVIAKENNNCTCAEPDYSITNTCTIPTNGFLSTENRELQSINDSETSILKNSKKRVRKRTHKKNKNQFEPIESIKNDNLDIKVDTSITSSTESRKMHKRFKLENGENNQQDYSTAVSSDESVHVTKEVFRCNSPGVVDLKINNLIKPIWKPEKSLKSKAIKVPVFVRGQTCTPKNTQNQSYTEVENDNKSCENVTIEDHDMLVVDWKNMTPLKITNISELQVHDLLQFKTLSMNECGEPEMSSVITARLSNIYGFTLTLQVLSGIQEFFKVVSKFKMENEDDVDVENQHEVEYNDLYEMYKLT